MDKHSGKSCCCFVSRKSDLAFKVTELVTQLSAAGFLTKYLQCNNTGVNAKGLSVLCTKFNIQMEMSAPYTPQQNGIVECIFVMICNQSGATMIKAKLSDENQRLLWTESVHTSTRLANIVSNTKDDKCLDEMFYGKRPAIYKHLIQIGSVGYMKIGKKQNKLEPKAVQSVMIGYAANQPGDTYRMYNIDTKEWITAATYSGQTGMALQHLAIT